MIFEGCGELPPPDGLPNNLWCLLSRSDQQAFLQLKNSFCRKNQPILCKDINASSFKNELESIRMFINSREDGVDQRSIVAGISFGSNCLISVNIQRLKTLFNRCKSSINKGFQLLNYASVKTKVQEHIYTCIPLLKHYPEEIRKWTIRIGNAFVPTPISIDNLSSFMSQTQSLQAMKNILSRHFMPKKQIPFEKETKQKSIEISTIQPKKDAKFAIPQISKSNSSDEPNSFSFNTPEIRIGDSTDNRHFDDWDTKVDNEYHVLDDYLWPFENEKSEVFDRLSDFSIKLPSENGYMMDNYEKHCDPQDDDMFFDGTSKDNGSSINIK